ncbi:iron complex transport system permease protein [Acetitomaculum ruminis DSM 5522]|uniref:Iron complex transport system permease protein n=1 Tax=Acetitomaculum ruminis DSM 5522 TaxID=1120918 RepID=A0A1I0ZSI4_9FIRM|nr:iron ABC transporter permease [Acetitomaculum ruminis]SFB27390.1 iron complex transport system permease protein [Acetitomaculum ruminis DSM 5522]
MKEKAETTAYSDYHKENMKRRFHITVVFIILIALFCTIIVYNINTGNVNISVADILRIIFLKEGDPHDINIIWRIRLPRILMAAILGGALALSGFLLQTFFENPIAGPFILGISSGAKLCVAIMMIYYVEHFGKMSSWSLVFAAFVGSMITTGFVLLVSKRIHNMAALLVAGVMIGYICNAATDFILNFSDDSDIVNLRGWTQGSFASMSWENVYFSVVLIGITFVAVFLLSKPIGAFQLGEGYAQSMGVNVKRFRVLLIMLSSILSATVTAFAGPISFVGIAVPFLIKSALKTAKPLVVIPATFLGGAVFCMICDLIARMAFAPTELTLSTVTSIFGAPVVIFMLIRRNQNRR